MFVAVKKVWGHQAVTWLAPGHRIKQQDSFSPHLPTTSSSPFQQTLHFHQKPLTKMEQFSKMLWILYWYILCWWWCCAVAKSCLTHCDAMDCSTPSFPVLHYLSELAQTHAHQVGDAIEPFHPVIPISSWSSPALESFPMSWLLASDGQYLKMNL